MKRLAWKLALLTCAVALAAAPARTTFPDAGFSIQTLEAPPESGSYLVLMMFLPPEQGFQPNVNVMVQTYDGTIADYLQLTLKQFEQLGYRTLRSGQRDGRTVYVEYSGRFQGRAMHWYAVAVAAASSWWPLAFHVRWGCLRSGFQLARATWSARPGRRVFRSVSRVSRLRAFPGLDLGPVPR